MSWRNQENTHPKKCTAFFREQALNLIIRPTINRNESTDDRIYVLTAQPIAHYAQEPSCIMMLLHDGTHTAVLFFGWVFFFVSFWLTTRTPRGAHVRGAKRNRIDRRSSHFDHFTALFVM